MAELGRLQHLVETAKNARFREETAGIDTISAKVVPDPATSPQMHAHYREHRSASRTSMWRQGVSARGRPRPSRWRSSTTRSQDGTASNERKARASDVAGTKYLSHFTGRSICIRSPSRGPNPLHFRFSHAARSILHAKGKSASSCLNATVRQCTPRLPARRKRGHERALRVIAQTVAVRNTC